MERTLSTGTMGDNIVKATRFLGLSFFDVVVGVVESVVVAVVTVDVTTTDATGVINVCVIVTASEVEDDVKATRLFILSVVVVGVVATVIAVVGVPAVACDDVIDAV